LLETVVNIELGKHEEDKCPV